MNVVLSLVILATVFVLNAAAEIRCTTGTVGSTCPDEAPVCCFINGKFTLGCCREDEVCKANGCAPAPAINTSYTSLTDSEVTIHFTGSDVVTFLLVVFLVLMGIFLLVCGGAQGSKRFAERAARRLAEQARAAEPNSDDETVDSDDERTFRKEMQDRKKTQEATEDDASGLKSPQVTADKSPEGKVAVLAAPSLKEVIAKVKENSREENDDAEEGESCEGDEKDGLLATSSGSNKETKNKLSTNTAVVPAAVVPALVIVSSTPRVSEADTATRIGPSVVGTCAVCCVAHVDCLLQDCNHSVVCNNCAKRLKYCPECKRKIRRRMQIFV